MKKLIIASALFATLLLSGCSTAPVMTVVETTPRGISIENITPDDKTKAYRTAEKHCAKYYKVPTIVQTTPQSGETEPVMNTTVFKCLKPNQ